MNSKGILTKLFNKNKNLIKNFSFLTILQFSQLLISLLLFPYLIKVLGQKYYGVVAYCQVIIGFLLIILNYGFNITVTKKISLYRDDILKLNKIIWTTYVAKGLILIVLSFIYFPLVLNIPFLYEYKTIYVYGYFSLIGWLLYPQWYFQGIQKMENITYVILTAKLLSLFCIIIFVKKDIDFVLVPIINSSSMIIAGLLGFFLLYKDFKSLKFHTNLFEIKKEFKKGSSIFFSNISSNAKEYISSFIIGSYLNYSIFAVYDISIRMIRLLITPSTILIKTVFPEFSYQKSKKMFIKTELLSLGYSIIIVIVLIILPDSLIKYLIDENLVLFKRVFSILIIILPLLSLCSSRGTLKLISFNRENDFSKGILISIIIYFTLLFILYHTYGFNVIGISIIVVVSLFSELLSHLYFGNKIKFLK